MINYDVPLNSRGNNANLRGNVLDDQTMTANGFYYKRWVRVEGLGYGVSLNITVSKELLGIIVLDDDFCQPYDYQAILRKNPDNAVALEVHSKVQATMKRLSANGIIEGWVVGDYF